MMMHDDDGDGDDDHYYEGDAIGDVDDGV